MRCMLTVWALGWAVCGFAQSQRFIYGEITEYSSSDVVREVQLSVIDEDTEESLTFAKKNNPRSGYFELLIDSRFDQLVLSKQGYQDDTVRIAELSGHIPKELLKMKRQITAYLNVSGPIKVEQTLISAQKDSFPASGTVRFRYGQRKSVTLTEDFRFLHISLEGYQDTTIVLQELFARPASERDFINCEISLKTLNKAFFGNSLTTAGKRDQKFGEIPASVTVVTRDQIQGMGYQSITEILKNVTGMYLFKDYAWSGGDPIIGVRGFFSQGFNNNVIVLVNGVNQYEDYWGFFPFASFNIPVEAIDRIEIVKGPMSVLYGSGAFFGVINIITNEQKDPNQELSAFGSASYGNLHSRRVSAGFEVNKNRLKISFTGSLSGTDGLDEPYARFLPDSMAATVGSETTAGFLRRENRYFNLSAGYQNEQKTLQVNMDVVSSYQARNVFESFVFSGNSCNCPIPDANPDATGSLNRTISNYGGIDLIYNPNSISYNFSFYYRNYRTQIDYSAGGNRIGLSSFSSKALEMEGSISGEPTKNISGIVGVNIRSADDLFTTFDLPNAQLSNGNRFIKLADDDHLSLFSFFSEANYKFSDHFSITGGLRAEALADFTYAINSDTVTNQAIPPTLQPINDLNPIFIPRLALVYGFDLRKKQASSEVDQSSKAYNNYLKLLYGEATKRPSFGNYTDNQTLRFPRIQTLELNYLSNLIATDSFRVILNTSVYLNNGSDLISRSSSVRNGESVYRSENAREVRTLGTEATINLIIGKLKKGLINLELSASINTTSERQVIVTDSVEVSGRAPAYSPEFLGYFKAEYRRKFALTELTFGTSMRYISEVYAPYDQQVGSNGELIVYRIGERVPGYLVANLNARVQGFAKGAFWQSLFASATVTNFLDARVQYPTTGNNSAWAAQGTAGYGLRFHFSIGFNY